MLAVIEAVGPPAARSSARVCASVRVRPLTRVPWPDTRRRGRIGLRVRVLQTCAGLTARRALGRHRYPRADRRSQTDRAVDLQRSAECADAVGEPAQARAPRGIDAAAAMVANLDRCVFV